MNDFPIAFVGGGNMAASLVGGLLAAGMSAGRIRVAEPDPERRARLAERYGVEALTDNVQAVRGAEVVVLAVKPQVMESVARALAPALGHRPLVLSVAAGIRTDALQGWLGPAVPVVRAMPNTPALVGSGASGLYAPPSVPAALRERAESVMRAVGVVVWVDAEERMDAVTALSGSGPAYVLRVMEAMEAAGVALGLPPGDARLLTLETAFGAAKLALESGKPLAELRRRVTSPGGTTEAALAVLEAGDLGGLFEAAMRAACERSRELADALGGADVERSSTNR